MSRIDIARLRKHYGISQNELAQQLQINQSFLSAIENGRSPLPVEKVEMICGLFGLKNLDEFTIEEDDSPDHHHVHHERIDTLEQQLSAMIERIDFLLRHNESLARRNDELAARCDELRDEVDRLRREK